MYSFTTTRTATTTTQTITTDVADYSKTASYLWYDVTISTAANCTEDHGYTSGWYRDGTTVS